MKQKFQFGDKVKVVPSQDHNEAAKANYSKVLEIKDVKVTADKSILYKVNNIRGYARQSELELA